MSRLVEALDYIGAPLAAADRQALDAAVREAESAPARDARGRETAHAGATAAMQKVLDRYALFDVHINPESRVKVTAGAAKPELVQHGWRTFLVKVRNEAGVTAALKIESPQGQRVWSRGPRGSSMSPRPEQTITPRDVADRWLDLSLFDKPPLTPTLSGLEVEYRIIQLYSRDAGKREATIAFNVGQGTQDIGFRNDLPVLFTCLPARDVTLRVADEHGKPAIASFVIKDAQGRVYPSPGEAARAGFRLPPAGVSRRWRDDQAAGGGIHDGGVARAGIHPAEAHAARHRWPRGSAPPPSVRRPCGSSGGSICREWAGIPAIITCTPPDACTTSRPPKASSRRT